ncbi:hypothetical protein [Spongiactinospora sp. 9N601]|uniref:hypothetical protein n=1 Tax=Spongiactinospora sp. 9N601 TaxID=3375149 RepID=UPI0037B1B25E
MTSPNPPPRMIRIEIDGYKCDIPSVEIFVYLARVYADMDGSKVTHRYVSHRNEEAWTFLRDHLSPGGYGEVLAYSVMFPKSPQMIRAIGRIDYP